MIAGSAANSESFKVSTPSDHEIRMTRVFDAPRQLVFEAMTKPEHVKQWWGRLGEGYSVPVCEVDLRVGGKWRFVNRHPKGEAAFHGEYREIEPDERIVSTEIFEGMPEGLPEEVSVNTATFTEEDGRTTLTLLIQAANKTSRDAIIESGMEDGLQDALDLLEETAQSIR